MDELNFSNGNKLNLSKLKSGSQIDDKNIFLKKYDKNGNSIFDADELEELKTDLKTAAGDDKKLDKNEALNLFAKVFGINKTKAQEMSNDGDLIETSILEQIKQQTKETAVKQIQNNANQAMEIYQQAVGGAISKGWNSIKELFNSEYTKDKVYRQIATQQVAGMLLEKAQKGGLTKKEYIENKISLLKGLLGADKFSKAEQEQIEKSISNMTMREIDSLIVRLKNAENNEYPELVKETISELAKGNKNNDGVAFSIENPNSVGAQLRTSGEEVLDFETVYLMEQGVPFNPENIEEYEQKSKVVQGIAILNNIVAEVNNTLDAPLKNLENVNRYAGTPKQLYKDLSTAILNTLYKLYGNDENTIKEKLQELGGKHATIKDGVIDFGAEGINNASLIELAKKIKSNLQQNLEKALDGKSIEDYNAELKAAHDFAYGAKNAVDLAEKFQESQAEGIGYAKMGASALGTAVMLVTGTGIIPLIASTGIGVLGSIGVSYTEAQTKKNGITPEDKKAILEELKTTLKLMPAGMFAGGVANNVCKQLLLKHCPTLLAKCAEIGTDASLSLLADLTITGEIDLKGEGFAQIMSIIQGIILENKMAARMGGKTPNTPTPQNKDINPDSTTPAKRPQDTNSPKPINTDIGIDVVESKLAFFKDVDGEPIFKESDIEVIKANYNEQELAKLGLIIDTILQNEPQGQFRMIHAADKIKAVLNNIGNKELDFALDVLSFKSKDDVLFDIEYDNIFKLISPQDIPNMKFLLEYAKTGENPVLQNINNLLDIASDCRQFSPSEIRQILEMKNPDGSFVINKDNYFNLAKNKFKDLNLELTPERKAEIETKLENKYKSFLKEDELQAIKSAIKNPRTARIIDKILDMKDADGKNAFDLETIKTTAEFINKNPDKLDILEKLIQQREKTILYNQKNNKNDASFKIGYEAILKFIDDDTSIEIVNKLLDRPLEEFYWRPTGGICHQLQTAQNPQKAKGLILQIMKKYPQDKDLEILKHLKDDQSYNILAKILGNNDKNNYSYFDIQIFLAQYQFHKVDFPEYAVTMAKAIDKGASPQVIKNLRYFIAMEKRQNAAFIDCSINLGSLKNKNGDYKFSEHSLLYLMRCAINKGIDPAGLEKIIKANPNATTHELLKILNGENITTPNKYKNPFGDNGIFKKEYQRIIQTDIWKQLPHDTQAKMFDYLSDLVQKDPNRFKRLVNSGYFELCSQGKCNIYELIKNFETNKFFSKQYLEDVQRLYSGEPLVKEFPNGTDLQTIAKQVPSGEAAYVNGKMYVNEDGVMKELNITKEKFEELFPLEGRFNTHQGNLGDCWLISALDNLMDLPVGRAKLYQMISQEGDDIIITFPNKVTGGEPIQIRFPKGEIKNSLSGKQLNGCKGLSLIEKAYSIMRGRENNSKITKYEMESIVDIDAQMKILEGGHSEEFISAILGYDYRSNNWDDTSYIDKTGNVKGTRYDFPNDISVDEAIDIIKSLANNGKALLHASTLHLPEDSTKIEKTLSAPNDLYSNHAYTIKGFNEERGLVYFTNPWNANQIVEMDVYTFLGYIDDITYMEL